MARQYLSDLQRTVLEWVNLGCPSESTPSGNYKTSARSLAGYGLVKVKGHGDTWAASITDRGIRVLTGAESLRPKKKKTVDNKELASGKASATASPICNSTTRPTCFAPTKTETKTLLIAIESAHRGYFRFKCSEEDFESEWELRLKAAQRAVQEEHGSRQLIFRLEKKDWWSARPTHVQAGLVEKVVFTELSLGTLDGRRRVNKLHPLVARFTDKTNFDVTNRTAPRAKRLLHVLFTEAERLGWELESRVIESHSWNVLSREGVFLEGREVRVSEQCDKIEREPTKKEIADFNRYNWDGNRTMKKLYNRVPNGLLSIEIGWGRINDTKRKPRRLDTALATRLNDMAVERFFSNSDKDFKHEAEKSWKRRLDQATRILSDRKARAFELEALRSHARDFREYQGLLSFVGELEGRIDVDEGYLSWCKQVLDRENPVPVLAIPQAPELDRGKFKNQIEDIAQTLSDPEMDVWTAVEFDS